ncbi:replication initiation factor domain-containing protein [Rhodoferax sp.]|uniref:replication initiation factor domain-containing protein n=1 Tax=Rhodoferax sp. TaxID=50421 RepID=UPI0027272EED|nr:replication initiation factor domain-containing protein [Rhodoferax sp.]MDO9195337.1 replication initiation factor domain-containing protein [Rhodoferax sp.]
MSWPNVSHLVLDGSEVKLRLLAERHFSKSPVHLDWVRFTTLRRNVATPSIDSLFPKPLELSANFSLEEYRLKEAEMVRQGVERRMPLRDFDAVEQFEAAAQAHELALNVAAALGPQFSVAVEPRKGIDFYKFRWSIELNGAECGWVGFLASSESPRLQSQAKTIHCNLFGTACTFADIGWNFRIADLIDENQGDVTRCDLALDFFDGIEGGIDSIRSDYRLGLCNVGGRKLKFNMVGDWENGHDRSLYIGSREAGKITNAYEKGDQLFGEKSNSEWLRIELRYGNKLRVLSSEMLRRPADFFAGASDWHASMLLKADAIVSPEPVKTTPRLQIETVLAECTRNARWMLETAAASFGVAVKYLSESQLWELVEHQKRPGRLQKFSESEIASSFSAAFARLKSFSSVECSPAFA